MSITVSKCGPMGYCKHMKGEIKRTGKGNGVTHVFTHEDLKPIGKIQVSRTSRGIGVRQDDQLVGNMFKFCPWCGGELVTPKVPAAARPARMAA